jgi:Domain of unknown function (DUF1995)
MTRRFFIAFLLLHVRWYKEAVFSFILTHRTTISYLNRHFVPNQPFHFSGSSHQASQSSSQSNNEPDDSSIDEIRSMLETAWNQTTMGRIPTTPELAVQECLEALRQAERNGAPKLYFIELLLPQYDISAGPKVYDELLLVEFAMLLIQRWQGRALLAVRDQRVLDTVTRVFRARWGRDVTQSTTMMATENPPIVESTKKNETATGGVENRPWVEFDDFGAAPFVEKKVTPEKDANDSPASLWSSTGTPDDIASFRELLLQNWNATTVDDLDSIRDEERLWDEEEEEEEDDANPSHEKEETYNQDEPQYYRLTSLLGSHPISGGADMMNDVVAAVKANALPRDEEEILVFLSPCTKEELYAIRALVSRYESNKTMLFINCQLDPLPQELLRGTTVYSLRPWLARPRNGGSATRLVVLRRYPADWQIYGREDRGAWHRLPATFVGRLRGPTREWIQTVVRQYLPASPPTT